MRPSSLPVLLLRASRPVIWVLTAAACLAFVPVPRDSTPRPRQVESGPDSCQALLAADRPDAALAAARDVVAAHPDDLQTLLCLGAAAVMLEQYPEAVPALERVLARRPDNPDALFGLAQAYTALGDARAPAMYERLVRIMPDDTEVRRAYVEYLWTHRQTAQGNTEMTRLIVAHPDRPSLRVDYAVELLLHQRQFLQAAEQLERAWAAGAATYRVAYLLANAWWEAGEIDRAITNFHTAIAIDPANPLARHGAGRLYLWRGQAEMALPHLEQAALSSDSAAIQLDLGRAYEGVGRIDEAERAYRAALALEPSLSPLYYALGRLLARAGRDEESAEALATYRRYYEAEQRRRFEEKSQQAALDSARLALRRGDAAAALTRFERLGDTPDALVGRAEALVQLSRHAEAVRVLERARVLAPDDPRVAYLLSRVLEDARGPKPP